MQNPSTQYTTCENIHENTENLCGDWDAFDASIRSDDAHWHEAEDTHGN